MKRIVFTLLFVVFICHNGLAQIEFGPRVSMVNSKINMDWDVPISNLTDNGGRQTGFQVGFFVREKLPLKDWYIQPELLYGKLDSRFSVESFDFHFEFSRLDAPVMIGRKLGPIRLNAGPVFRYIMKAETNTQQGLMDVTDSLETFDIWWQAGIGTDIKGFVIDLRYGRGDSAFGEQSVLGGWQIDAERGHLILSLGYKLIK